MNNSSPARDLAARLNGLGIPATAGPTHVDALGLRLDVADGGKGWEGAFWDSPIRRADPLDVLIVGIRHKLLVNAKELEGKRCAAAWLGAAAPEHDTAGDARLMAAVTQLAAVVAAERGER